MCTSPGGRAPLASMRACSSSAACREALMASEFIVLSHREPYQEIETEDGPRLQRKTNGVFTTLDAVMRSRHGTWIAWKEIDPEHPFQTWIEVPSPRHPDRYNVHRIGLDADEARRFYYEFTSSAIWPVLFSLLDRARFTLDSWETYIRVNQEFADVVCEEAAPNAIVWVNDFHLMLTPELIRRRRPDLTLALFLHTTFPPPDVFAVIPWRKELLRGLLNLDLIGFHIPSYAVNFADTVSRFMGATPSAIAETELMAEGPAVAVPTYPRVIEFEGRRVALGAYPVGVDVPYFAEVAQRPDTRDQAAEIRARTGAETIILSAERLDYVKGAIERLECFERFLERHPEQHSRTSFVQIAVPTRTGMEEFQTMRRRAEEAVGRINGRFGTMEWQPVMHFYGSFAREQLVAFYATADVLWVTPLRDGLNLVVKEYIASRLGSEGVVILSEFAGAAAELREVVLTNPYSPDDMDRALEKALGMNEGERNARMLALRDRVINFDVHKWSQRFLGDVERVGSATGTILTP
ncbi:MAG: trehalose-6-phosphate synthase [Gemmatimonas sp.]|nr:trehalose-6-phosphate synthase [Gemmatimonas sp.]